MNFPGPTKEEIKDKLPNIKKEPEKAFIKIGKLGDIELLEYLIKTNPGILTHLSQLKESGLPYKVGKYLDYKSLKYLLENYSKFRNIMNDDFVYGLLQSESNYYFLFELLQKYPSKAFIALETISTLPGGTSEILNYLLDNHFSNISLMNLKVARDRLEHKNRIKDMSKAEVKEVLEEAMERKKEKDNK